MEKISVTKGGIFVEEKMFRWEIKNFDVIVKNNEELLEMVDEEFHFTDSNGVKSCWRFWFTYDYDYPYKEYEEDRDESERSLGDKVLMLNYKLKKKDGYCSKMNIELFVKCEDAVGTKIFEDSSTHDDSGHASCRHTDADDNSWHWEINKLNPKDLELIDGTLIVLITLKAFTPIPTVRSEEVQNVKDLNGNRDERFSRMIAKLENDEKYSDVKIISGDGQEFFAYRWILSEASAVFEAMFRSDMKENRTREVKLPNLSGTALRHLLHFIYTRELGNEWSAPGVVEELIEAADQYQIKPLKDLLDANMGKVCTTENAGKLLELAERTSLKKAVGDILAFIRAKCHQPQGFFEIFKRAKLS